MRNDRWFGSISLGIGMILGTILTILGVGGSSVAWAQLDIFEQPKDQPPPRRRGFTFGTIRLGGQAGRQLVVEGNRFYSQGDFASASLKFFRVVDRMAESKWRAQAEYLLALSLFRMGYLRSAQHFFSRIIEAGPAHVQYRNAIVYLVRISRGLQDQSFLGKLTRFRVSDLPRQYRDELLFLLGRYYYHNTKLAAAQRLAYAERMLTRVTRENPLFYARAQYILGAIYTAAAQPGADREGDFRKLAAERFRLCGSYAMRIKDPKIRQNTVELALMALARIHYEAKHFRGAIRYYSAIVRNSPRWLDATYEMAWAYLRRNRFDRTLGILHTLDSPYFRNEYYPEVGIMRAVSFFESCRYQDVKKLVGEYLERYRPLLGSMRTFLRRYPTPERLYGGLMELRNQEAVQGLDNDESGQMFQRILKLTFKDKTLLSMFQSVQLLEKEMGMIREAGEVWRSSALARRLQTLLTQQRQIKVADAGNHARSRFLEVLEELQSNVSLALKIRYETSGAEKELLQRSAQQQGSFRMRTRSRGKNNNRFSVSVHEDFVFWPFQGEYWVDELGYYRFRIKGECHRP